MDTPMLLLRKVPYYCDFKVTPSAKWQCESTEPSLLTSPHFPFAQAVTSSDTAQACLHSPVLTNTSSFSLHTRWLWTSCISSVACIQLIGSSAALCEHSYTASQPDMACVQGAWSTGRECGSVWSTLTMADGRSYTQRNRLHLLHL